jgi:hypothetical protein
MESLRSGSIVLALVISLLAGTLEASQAEASKKRAAGDQRSAVGQVTILGSVNPSEKDWVKNQILNGHPVVLTNAYLFQVMKCVSQENQIQTEEKLLIPLLTEVLGGMIEASKDPQTKRLFSVALVLLADKPGTEIPDDIAKQAAQIKENSLFKPRGHYTDSEALKRYFVSMQYLAKATIDVSINKASFPFPEEMLFPFETADSVRKLFTDPAHKKLVQKWAVVHSFYSSVNGPADVPTFVDLPMKASSDHLTKEDVEKWATQNHLPRINPERGLGIQPLGERYSLHEGVIDQVKTRFMKDDTPKQRIAELLAFKSLVQGYQGGDHAIKGFEEVIAEEKGDNYYVAAAKAIALAAQGWQDNPNRLNVYASALTALAEQTALMTKTSILVRKSAASPKKMPDGATLYFEPGAEKYIQALAKAAASMKAVCDQVAEEMPGNQGKDIKILDIAPAFAAFAKLASAKKPLKVGSREWQSHGSLVSELRRKPAVTVDVFQVKERGGKVSYYQWAIAPFQAAYAVESAPRKTPGLTMVFFEGWSDEMVQGSQGPLNNLEWETRVLEGNLGDLHSIVPLPKESAAR